MARKTLAGWPLSMYRDARGRYPSKRVRRLIYRIKAAKRFKK